MLLRRVAAFVSWAVVTRGFAEPPPLAKLLRTFGAWSFHRANSSYFIVKKIVGAATYGCPLMSCLGKEDLDRD